MPRLIDADALLAVLRGHLHQCEAGERSKPDDEEWTVMRDCYADAVRAAENAPTIKPQVVVNISGGLNQGSSADYPVDVYTLDFDVDSFDDDTTGVVIDGENAYLGDASAEIDPDFVRSVVEAPTVFFHNGAEVCSNCSGLCTVYVPSEQKMETCDHCKGSGEEPTPDEDASCPNCSNTDNDGSDVCPDCGDTMK